MSFVLRRCEGRCDLRGRGGIKYTLTQVTGRSIQTNHILIAVIQHMGRETLSKTIAANHRPTLKFVGFEEK